MNRLDSITRFSKVPATRSVPVEDDVYEFIQDQALYAEEGFSSVLRRLLHIGSEPKAIEPVRTIEQSRTKTGSQTREELFYLPVLESLAELGGKATAADVKVRVFAKMSHLFNEEDLKQVNSGRGARWEKQVGWVGHHLRHEGSIIKKSHGIWQLTDNGRRRLEAERKQNAKIHQDR